MPQLALKISSGGEGVGDLLLNVAAEALAEAGELDADGGFADA